MNLKPNITASGRWARAISGSLFLAIAGYSWLHGHPVGGAALNWTVGILALLFGGFQIFEAVSGWCVMRALGFRTPM